MGVCESCLGSGRRGRNGNSDETSRLLGGQFDESVDGSSLRLSDENIEQGLQKQREELEQLCINTSQRFIDASAFPHHMHDYTIEMVDIDKLILDIFDPSNLTSQSDPVSSDLSVRQGHDSAVATSTASVSTSPVKPDRPCMESEVGVAVGLDERGPAESEDRWLRMVRSRYDGQTPWSTVQLANLPVCVGTDIWDSVA